MAPTTGDTHRVSRRPSGTADASKRPAFTSLEWLRLGGFYAFIALLHVTGWGLCLHHASSDPALIGLGMAAYLFGVRHAFDADHIAAVDDTVRYLLRKGEKPLGVGFFFSLGHATVVLLLAVAIAFAAASMKEILPGLRDVGSLIGAGVSGLFLWVVGLLNLRGLLGILDVWRQARAGTHSHANLDRLLSQQGLLHRLFGGRLQRWVTRSWHLYPLGVMFGLGFDTASEIGLLTMTAGASTGRLSVSAVLALPILFAAGMSLMDTTDGVLMSKAYDWACVDPLRRIFYNITTTSLSVGVALVVGTTELLQVFVRLLDLRGGIFDRVRTLDFGLVGYGIVGTFLLAWAVSILYWKLGRFEERHGRAERLPASHDRAPSRNDAPVPAGSNGFRSPA